MGGGEAPNYMLSYATNASGAPATNRIANAGYAHDAAGTMTGDGAAAYDYDGANRLKTAEANNGSEHVGRAVAGLEELRRSVLLGALGSSREREDADKWGGRLGLSGGIRSARADPGRIRRGDLSQQPEVHGLREGLGDESGPRQGADLSSQSREVHAGGPAGARGGGSGQFAEPESLQLGLDHRFGHDHRSSRIL